MLSRILLLALAAAPLSANSVYMITVNTSGLSGTSGFLAFDLVSGGGPSQNSVSLEGFSSDGIFGANPSSTTGTVIGGPLPATSTLADDPNSSAFNEYQAAFTFGSTISFTVDGTENAPGAGSSPDEFSFFLLASDDATSLINTDDPTSSNALLILDLDGTANGAPSVFNVSSPAGVSANMSLPSGPAAPEPSSWPILVGLCLCAVGYRLRRCPKTAHQGASSLRGQRAS